MLIIRFVAVRTVDAGPSRLVALRRSSCVLVDTSLLVAVSVKRLVTWSHSFNICAKINEMLDVSITKLSTLHSPLSTAVSALCRAILNFNEFLFMD